MNLASKSLLSLFMVALISSPLISCKKGEAGKKGVLEVKKSINLGNSIETYYRAFQVESGKYEAGKEFEYSTNAGLDVEVGYYWPDESAKSLGYKNYCDEVEPYYTSQDECNSKEPGLSGHWASEASAGGSGGDNGACPVGTWYGTACGDKKGVVWTFNSNGRGSISNKDCSGICNPIVYTFSYKMSGTTCNLTYDKTQAIVKCDGFEDSRPPAPKDASITITCNGGSSITVSSANGSTTFTK